MMNRKELKLRLVELDKRQTDIVRELQKRGFKSLDRATFSSYLSRTRTGPQADTVLALAEEIVTQWEKEAKER